MSGLAALDIILIIPLLFGFIRGLQRGLINEIASVISLVAGLVLAFYFSESLYQRIKVFVDEPGIELRVFAYIVVFIITIVIINLISKAITKALNALALGSINHIFGGLFGLSKWLLIMLILVYLLKSMQEEAAIFQSNTLEDSFVYRQMALYSESLSDYIDLALGRGSETSPT